MIIRLLTALLVFSSFIIPAGKEELIPWSKDRKLEWADFKAKPDPGTENAALTSSAIGFGWGFDEKGFSYTVKCSFDKQKSWGRIKNDHILAHEQGHFDITEIYARKLHKALKGYAFKGKSSEKELQSIYAKLMTEQEQLQARYDRETEHSKKLPEQKEWLVKIATELRELNDYSDY